MDYPGFNIGSHCAIQLHPLLINNARVTAYIGKSAHNVSRKYCFSVLNLKRHSMKLIISNFQWCTLSYSIQHAFHKVCNDGASVAHLPERAPFTSANVGSIPVGNDL